MPKKVVDMATIDNLDIKISASAELANLAIGRLIDDLGALEKALNKTRHLFMI